jgi:hypothetical protein
MAKERKRRRRATRVQKPLTGVTTAPAATLNSHQNAALFLFAALAVSVYLHFNSSKFPDPDIFYHFRHAAIYAGGGLFSGEFPWVPYSVIGKFSSDIWYGFHVLLIPFAWAGDPILGMRLAGIFVTAVCIFFVYLACVRLDIKPALLWPFVLLFSSAFLLHRLTMLRPHVLSLGLNVLLLALIAAGNIRGVFIAAFASAWIHLSLFFVPVILLGVFVGTKLLTEKSLAWRESLALAGGLVAGWLLRPNPLSAAKIAYVQVFQLTFEKLGGAPLEFGSELRPLAIAIYSNYLAFIVLWASSLLLLLWKSFRGRTQLPAAQRTVLRASSMLSALFFLLAVLFARRAFDFCSSFGMVLIALVFTRFLFQVNWLRIGLLGLCIFLALYGISLRNRVLAVGWDADRLAGAAKWIEANSKPGDIVFNVRWEYFPELFFWNTKNYYTGGMDPIFQYVYEPELYRAGLSFAAPRRSFLCVTGNCPEGTASDPYPILKERFKARYVFLLKQADANVYFYLLSDKRFLLKIEDHISAVFEVL